MSHRFILSSTPYLKQSGRPIYKVPTRGNLHNPNHMQPGPVQRIIQLREEQKDMLEIILTPPIENVEIAQDVDSTQEQEPGTIVITLIEEEVREPVKTRKIRVGNKVKIVPIEYGRG